MGKRTFDELFALIDTSDLSRCWVWPGGVTKAGYGHAPGQRRNGTTNLAHRLVYAAMVRSLDPSEVLDHLCHRADECRGGDSCPHRRCVNPMHLAPTTSSANVRRSARERRTCQRGHRWTSENTRWKRSRRGHGGQIRLCRECEKIRAVADANRLYDSKWTESVFLLADRGMSQRGIARQLGISQSHISKMLTRRRTVSVQQTTVA